MITIKFNWANVLFYLFFLSYGYFAAMTSSIDEVIARPYIFIFKNLILIITLCTFGFCARKFKQYYEDTLEIKYSDFLGLLVIAFILLIIESDLTQSLISDEIAYSYVSLSYSEYIAQYLIKYTAAFDDLNYSNFVQVISLFIILCFGALFFFSRKLPFKKKIVFFAVALILIRVVISYIHGNSFPHPPLNLIPTLVFGSLFGINDIVLKLSFFSGYLFFIFILNKLLTQSFNNVIALLLTLSIATIPLLFNFAFRIEHSLWGAIAFTLVLLELVISTKINYIRIISFIAIFSMLRMPVFIAIFPILLHYFLYLYQWK